MLLRAYLNIWFPPLIGQLDTSEQCGELYVVLYVISVFFGHKDAEILLRNMFTILGSVIILQVQTYR